MLVTLETKGLTVNPASKEEYRGAFHLGKKPGNFAGSKSGISDR